MGGGVKGTGGGEGDGVGAYLWELSTGAAQMKRNDRLGQ